MSAMIVSPLNTALLLNKHSSPKVYSPAKRSHADFAATSSSKSESEDSVVILSPAVKHLKMTGEDDSPKEESDSEESIDDEDDGGGDKSSSERERHEIDQVESDEEEGTGNEEEEELITCAPWCGTPCIWQQLGQEVIGHGVHNE